MSSAAVTMETGGETDENFNNRKNNYRPTFHDHNNVDVVNDDDDDPVEIVEEEDHLLHTSRPEEEVKNIVVMKNGDRFSAPKKIVVNKRQIRTWDAFLEELTLTLKPIHGAIRDIHTPYEGHRVRALDDLRPQGRYIAVSYGERLRLLESTQAVDTSPTRRQHHIPNGIRLDPIKPVVHSSLKAESRLHQVAQNRRKIIHVYRNGDPFARPINVLLTHFEQKDMEFVLRAVEERVILTSNNAIRKIFSMEGKRLLSPEDLEDGKFYVVTGSEQFQPCNYGHQVPHLILGSKLDRRQYENLKFLNQRPTPPKDKQRTPRSTNDSSQIPSGDVENRKPASTRTRSEDRVPTDKNRESEGKAVPKKQVNAAKEIQSAFRAYEDRKEVEKKRATPPIKKAANNSPKLVNNGNNNTATNGPVVRKVEPQSRKSQGPSPSSTTLDQTNRNNQEEISRQNDNKKDTINGNQVKPDENDYDEDQNSTTMQSEEDQAAATIQATFRGYKTRKDLATKQAIEEEEERQRKALEEEERQKKAKEEEEKAQLERERQAREAEELEKKRQQALAGEELERERQALEAEELERERQAREEELERERKSKEEEEEERERDRQAAAREVELEMERKAKEEEEKEKARQAAGEPTNDEPQKENPEEEEDEKKKEVDEAAAQIQAALLGYNTRKELSNKQQQVKQTEEEEEAATKIQAAFRGHKTRKELKENATSVNNKSSTKQKQESTVESEPVTEELPESDEADKAATKIQATFRGFKTRKDIQKVQKQENEAATKIQSQFRGYQVRKTMSNKSNDSKEQKDDDLVEGSHQSVP